ncbi:hypothetical protein BO70DRAFT_345250 [Aspergillus heteromorphus CBS 117.55]|uniref:FAD binding domain protein n=1 Tax=Aspergillus heteromorphus CBS 117.55 TaxID=1448321 RepID=A0A317V738_9EURO|nr:uncharacterized protein BO70DRAFT_345250 [Aspergillus heteromorphus CBS 117.55]PWY67950.1 hypothetical protein BO70DRAFT_345250 [Aspergillus heteromorphus CBS 117.55]
MSREVALGRLYERALATPLPDRNPHPHPHPPAPSSEEESYEVVIAGAGPAGLVLALLLARQGLRDPHAIRCVDPRPSPLPCGRADGLASRTLETFKELGIYEEVMAIGLEVAESVAWAEGPGSAGIARTARYSTGLHMPSSRVPHLASCPQGQIERLLARELFRYAPSALERGTQVVDVQVHEEDPARPVRVTLRDASGLDRAVRCRFLVGADGAHSTVRRSVGIEMLGNSSASAWGVIDFVPDTDYPDIRRLGNIHTSHGSVLHFPRERNVDGGWLCRFYVNMNDLDEDHPTGAGGAAVRVTPEGILARMAQILAPYRMQMKPGTQIEWVSTYEVGRRIASRFACPDASGLPRVFLVGDACHTHSPKVGQGMNVSIADSYNLAWKLAHVLRGLSPRARCLLDSYGSERRAVAEQLLDMDERWFRYEYDVKHADRPDNYSQGRTELLRCITGFASGQGIQYEAGYLTHPAKGPWTARPGTRLSHAALQRFADGLAGDLHDELIPDGRWKVVLFASTDLLRTDGRSATALASLYEEVIPAFVAGVLVGVTILPATVHAAGATDTATDVPTNDLDWRSLPDCVKREAEMKTFIAPRSTYDLYGIEMADGAVMLMRPDGVVSMLVGLDEVSPRGKLADMLKTVIHTR